MKIIKSHRHISELAAEKKDEKKQKKKRRKKKKPRRSFYPVRSENNKAFTEKVVGGKFTASAQAFLQYIYPFPRQCE
jgi:hypothetical protein